MQWYQNQRSKFLTISFINLSSSFSFLNICGNFIFMYFIEKLLLSFEFDNILVTINQLTKQIIFISINDIIIFTVLACLFILHVFPKYDVPLYVIFNQGSEFVLNFFHSLNTALNIQFHFTSDYHSEGDGQTKCTNQSLKKYLYIYYNSDIQSIQKILLHILWIVRHHRCCYLELHGIDKEWRGFSPQIDR